MNLGGLSALLGLAVIAWALWPWSAAGLALLGAWWWWQRRR